MTNQELNTHQIKVIGHCNPDTDSICSAIAYSRLKNMIDPDRPCKPCRAGLLNRETEFVLDYFGVPAPQLYTDVRSQIRDVETEIAEDEQIAIAYIGGEIGKDGAGLADVELVVALPEQEEWTIYRETGTTMFNAMSSFTVKTDDNRELALLKDNCPMEEGALTKDSGDRVMVAYVTSGGTNFPIEVRKGE